ncbi:hypothetical protein [Acinetobacter sp. YH01022]|uniref:hypothetical protein n=1 Tax=Acinetobacter sp. YH01022 TaxID=2601036 RepID=UPI0015D44360|nr:hypothetical protein [Acinetobacter sp. YH01022]
MMNNHIQINPESHAFVAQDRMRLFTERNKFKALAEQHERELTETQVRSKNLISLLLCLNVVLIGVLVYVLQRT